MTSEKERMLILEMIENEQISAEEGVRLLSALDAVGEADGEGISPEPPVRQPPGIPDQAGFPSGEWDEVATPTPSPAEGGGPYARVLVDDDSGLSPEEDIPDENQGPAASDKGLPAGLPPEARRWKSWWMVPLWIGVAITVSGGFLMYLALENSGIGLGFICAGVPFLIGLALLVLAWQSRVAPWLHLRVQQRPGERPQRIAFSFPIPIRPTVWLLRIFGGRVKELNGVALDEMLLAVGDTASAENPIYIQVDEGDAGEKVEIYIG